VLYQGKAVTALIFQSRFMLQSDVQVATIWISICTV